MDDGRRELGEGRRGLQMSIHLLYTESNNMGFTYQNPFCHFYWHSPTVYKKYYTRVDRSHHKTNKQNKKNPNKIHKNQYLFLKKYQEKKKVYI